MSLSLQCEFWAVGQGLFSSGKILSGGNPTFSWVYDCGQKPDKHKKTIALDNAIAEMNKSYGDIDLLVISHFDQDHINGISKLLSTRNKVKYILLPYYPLWQRLIIAKYLDIRSDDDIFSFYLNPVQYFIDKGKIETVLLLPSYDNNDSPIKLGVQNEKENELKLSFTDPYSKEFDAFSTKVQWVDPKVPLVFDLIEFVPYNVPFEKLPAKPKNKNVFQQQVEALCNQSSLNITALRNLYDQYLVRKSSNNKSTDRNIISLFLYVAFLNQETNRKIMYTQTKNNQSNFLFANNVWNGYQNTDYRDAILYSGDACLKAKRRRTHLCSTLGNDRINRICSFQVVHHGSRHNWKIGFSQTLQPNLTIFNADPTAGYNHPHSDVVFDFVQHNPILVDKTNTLKFTIS